MAAKVGTRVDVTDSRQCSQITGLVGIVSQRWIITLEGRWLSMRLRWERIDSVMDGFIRAKEC